MMKLIITSYLLILSFSAFAQTECQFTMPATVKNVNGHYPVEIVSNCSVYKVEVTVFNRWGVEVYKTNNLIHDWQGKDTPDGTYYILVKGEYRNREKFESTGFVTYLK